MADFTFSDNFDRANGPLGAPWLTARDFPECWDNFETPGIYGNGVAVTGNFQRQGVYAADESLSPPVGKTMHNGITWAAIETQRRSASVSVVWTGNRGFGNPNSHVEGAPLVKITPGSKRLGVGCWVSDFAGAPVLLVGYIGNPPELAAQGDQPLLTATGMPGGHVSGTPRTIRVDAIQAGATCGIKVYVDGAQVSFPVHGTNAIPIHPELCKATLHGFALDAHRVLPVSTVPTKIGINSFSLTATGARFIKRPPTSLNSSYRRGAKALAGAGTRASLATVRKALNLGGSKERLGLRTLFLGGASTGDDALNTVRFRDAPGAASFPKGNASYKNLWTLLGDLPLGHDLYGGTAAESDYLVLPPT